MNLENIAKKCLISDLKSSKLIEPMTTQPKHKKHDIIHIEMKSNDFFVERDFLIQHKNSQLESKFSNLGQTHFVMDRDPKIFKLLLKYLQNNRDLQPRDLSDQDRSAFMEELRFWGLQPNISTEPTLNPEDLSSDKFGLTAANHH